MTVKLDFKNSKNLHGETIDVCVRRLRAEHGLFAEGHALTLWRFFEGQKNEELTLYYKVVARLLESGEHV